MDATTPSSRRTRALRATLAAVAVPGFALALVACGGDDSGDSGSSADGTTTTAADEDGGSGGSADATLDVDSIAYNDVSAPVGGTLEIVNTSGVAHTFTADDGAFDESYGADETIDVTVPDEPGDYAFHCDIHPSMTGTLTVE